jgi:hypothetical protein
LKNGKTVPTKSCTNCVSISQDQATTNANQLPDNRRNVLIAGVAGAGVLLVHPAAATASTASPAGDWTSPGLAAPESDSLPKFFKTRSGVKVQEIAAGNGPIAQSGDAVLIDYGGCAMFSIKRAQFMQCCCGSTLR